jgi:hypothetical protein
MPGVALSLALSGVLLAPLVEGSGLGPGWRVATLPQQKPPVTRFTPERVQGREALRVEADGSYGNLVHGLAKASVPSTLAWSWRVQAPAPANDLRTKAGDDAAIKVCMSFDLPLEQVPFWERQGLRLARARSGEPLPAATLCWVWGGRDPRGTVLANAYSRRVRYIVLRSAADATDTWMEERRDVAADFVLAFGDEAPQPPPVTALIVAGDADNTGGRSVAFVADLRLEP